MFNIVRTAETGVQHCHFTSTCSAFANENSFFHSTLARSHTHSQIDYNLTVSNSLALALCPNQRSHYLCPLCLFSVLLQKQCLHFLLFLLGTRCDLSSGRKPPWLFKLEKNIFPSTVIKQVHAQTHPPPQKKPRHPGVCKKHTRRCTVLKLSTPREIIYLARLL